MNLFNRPRSGMELAQFISSTRLRDFDIFCDGECKREKRKKKIGRNLKNRFFNDEINRSRIFIRA